MQQKAKVYRLEGMEGMEGRRKNTKQSGTMGTICDKPQRFRFGMEKGNVNRSTVSRNSRWKRLPKEME